MTAAARTIALWVLLGALAAPCLAQGVRDVRGRVVDAEGAPVAGVRVATAWTFDGEDADARWRSDAGSSANPEVRTDADGRFSGALYLDGRPVALIALDLEGRRGGIAIVDEDALDDECAVTLEPLVRVTGRARVTEPSLDDGPLYVYVFDPRAPIAVVRAIERDRAFSFALPPGSYDSSITGADLESVQVPVVLDAASPEADLGTIELQPTGLARHYGKPPPPWTITDARGASPDVQLSDLKGKWVLIEFWAHW